MVACVAALVSLAAQPWPAGGGAAAGTAGSRPAEWVVPSEGVGGDLRRVPASGRARRSGRVRARVARPITAMAPLTARRAVLQAIQSALHWCGPEAAYVRACRPRGAQVVQYHSVAADDTGRFVEPSMRMRPEVFREQVRFLASRRRVVSMSDLVGWMERGGEGNGLPPNTVVITFDDGYADTLEVAAPILAEHGLPAIVYLPTALIGRGEAMPIDRLYTMFASRTRDRLTLPAGADGPSRGADLSHDGGREAAYRALAGRLMSASRDERDALLEMVREQLRPSAEAPRGLLMDWERVRELLRRYPGIEVGLHTRDHLDLSSRPEAEAREQIEGSIRDAEAALGRRLEHFAFPYNRSNAAARAIVREAGLRSATAESERVRVEPGSDRFCIPRLYTHLPRGVFRFRTSAAYPGLSRALLGRA
jgi:peptidoglycan/xylan/chitin deacetylase (PgdA/CDA1 family)